MKHNEKKPSKGSVNRPSESPKSDSASTNEKPFLDYETEDNSLNKQSNQNRDSSGKGIVRKYNHSDIKDSSCFKVRGRRKFPLPDHARNMSLDELNRNMCLYILLRWEFYIAVAVFVLTVAYFPWYLISSIGVVRVLVSGIEKINPSISGLPAELRQMPLDASKAQLSFIHFCGAVSFAYKIITQKPAVWRVISTNRLFVGFILGLILCIYPVYPLFFWEGYFDVGADQLLHSTTLKLTCWHAFWWLALTLFFSLTFSFLQELIRKNRSS